MDLLTQVQRTIVDHRMLGSGDAVVVGVSGGPDSVCLLHVLLQIRDDHNLRLQVAHLNHGARGRDADCDAAFVGGLSQSWGVAALTERVDVPAFARSRGIAFEEAARRVRYDFLARVAGAVGASRIAVGHNADDQAETVLMHLVRGTGLAGLRGMLPVTPLASLRQLESPGERGGGGELGDSTVTPTHPSRRSWTDKMAVIRPLLDVPRTEIEEYCTKNRLAYRFDRSNLDSTYFRNRLRHELLPLLRTYNPKIRDRLRHTAAIVAADYELLASLGDQAWLEVAGRDATGEAFSIDRRAWKVLPTALQRATLRRGIRELRPDLRDVSYRHVEDARRLGHTGSPGAQATLPAQLVLRVGYDTLTLGDISSAEPFPDEPLIWDATSVPVSVPGATMLPGSPWGVVATVLQDWDIAQIRANQQGWTAHLDGEQVREPVMLRTRQPGDTFRPQGMGGRSAKLGAFLINRKVPRHVREHVPLLVASGRILWVCGHRIAEGAGVGARTRQVVRLRFGRVLGEVSGVHRHPVLRAGAPGDGDA